MKNLNTFVMPLICLSSMGFIIACGGYGSGRAIQTTTARQIKDRQTLKDFVLDARNYLEKDYQQAIEDFRDENGPWRHNEVYLMILDEDARIHFHAGIPSLEGQQDVGLVDLATGRVIVDQLITAALRGGDYVEYHFDDPSTVEKERSLKITYVTPINRSGYGPGHEPTLIIGAGFFPDR